MKRCVLLTGGGTAGHITPTLAVAARLHEVDKGLKLVYVIERGNPNESLISDSKLPIVIKRIPAGKFRRYHGRGVLSHIADARTNLLNLRDFIFTIVGFITALYLLIRIRPSVVFSKGGYVSVPVALASFLTRRKLITHDSDSLPGLANRIAGKFARLNAVGDSGGKYPYKPEKIVFTGVPVNAEYRQRAGKQISEMKRDIGLPKDSLVLLIGGSTQGARKIDNAIEGLVPKLLAEHKNLYIVHVFGRLNEDSLQERYRDIATELAARLILKAFLDDQWSYAAAADVVVTRAGATALAEYGVLGKACVVIPAPQLTGGHQLYNARSLEEREAILVVPESDAPERLGKSIEYLLQHDDKRQALGRNFQKITPGDADQKLADLILKML